MASFESFDHQPTPSGFEVPHIHSEQNYKAAVDSPHGGDPAHAKQGADELQETSSENSSRAQYGAHAAIQGGSVKGDETSFKASSGVFTSGEHVGSYFDRAVRDSGGVRQGLTWTSDKAPGVYRSVVEHTITIENLKARSEFEPNGNAHAGRTFESQRRAHWVKD